MEALINNIAANIVEYFSLGGLFVRYVVEVEDLRAWLQGKWFFTANFFYAASVCHDVLVGIILFGVRLEH